MEPNALVPGDVVQLLDGSYLMTVAEVNGTQARCLWFEGPKGPYEAAYPLYQLIRQ